MWSPIQSLLSRIFWLARKRNPAVFGPEANPENRAPASLLAIVGLVLDEQDRRLLADLGSRNQWKVSFAETVEEARALSDDLGSPAVLWDRDAAGTDWREAVEALWVSPHRPCVLLLSTVVDDYLWNEVIRRGGYDVLAKPLREADVMRAVKLAWSYWNSKKRTGARAPSAASSFQS